MLARRFLESMGTPLPATALTLDSSPGKGSCEAAVHAFSDALPWNPAIRRIGILVLQLAWWLDRMYNLLAGLFVENGHLKSVERARMELNDTKFDMSKILVYSDIIR